MKTTNFEINAAQSIIEWIGRKVTGSHFGTINIKQGLISATDGEVTDGKIVIDNSSIKILDVTDPGLNAQFAAHLASDDFFSSAQYPEAVYEITGSRGNHINGRLTIKGITHPVSFDADVKITGDTLTATGKIVVDRTKFDIKFRSGNFFQNLGDTLIYNDFDLNVNITAKAVA